MNSRSVEPGGLATKTSPASATLALAQEVIHLDPEAAVFDAMVTGWSTQMSSRGLKAATIVSRVWLLQRFAGYTNEYPWQWGPADVEEFCASLRSGQPSCALSTIRGYQAQLGLFCDYACDPAVGPRCARSASDRIPCRYAPSGTAPKMSPITRATRAGGRSPQTRLQAFFDHADDEVERIRRSGRKGGAGRLP